MSVLVPKLPSLLFFIIDAMILSLKSCMLPSSNRCHSHAFFPLLEQKGHERIPQEGMKHTSLRALLAQITARSPPQPFGLIRAPGQVMQDAVAILGS
jgi:hypothetical protein